MHIKGEAVCILNRGSVSSFFLVDVLRLGEILDIFAEGLIVAAGFFDVLPVLVASCLQVLDFMVQVH